MKAEAAKAATEAKKRVSTPETTAAQLEADSTETTTTTTKKQTAAEARKELSDLRESALATRQKLTQSEITFQKARSILRGEGTPGLTMQQDHYRLAQMVKDLRKLFRVEAEEISGGQ